MKAPPNEDLAAGAFGLLALALGLGGVLGVLRPGEEGMGNNVPALSFAALIAGVVGLYLARTTGLARQLAILGCGVALLAVALFGGAVAFEAILDAGA